MTTARRALGVAVLAALLSTSSAYAMPSATFAAHRAAPSYTKVLVIVEENRTYAQIIGATRAPYLTGLAAAFGSATNMSASYPVGCQSLGGYILMTSGSTGGICDDRGPRHHVLTGDNIFAQVAAAHLTSRTYAENIPTPCARNNSNDGVFLVRHTPVTYYSTETARCPTEDVAMGTLTGGALHDDITAGTLPSYAFVTPDACDDMHGAGPCPNHRIVDGDTWLSRWIPALTNGADYRAGRLVIIITWDEGSRTSNHIPTVVISPSTRAVVSATAYTHCSTLRTAEDILHLAPLRCAATAPSMTGAFHL